MLPREAIIPAATGGGGRIPRVEKFAIPTYEKFSLRRDVAKGTCEVTLGGPLLIVCTKINSPEGIWPFATLQASCSQYGRSVGGLLCSQRSCILLILERGDNQEDITRVFGSEGRNFRSPSQLLIIYTRVSAALRR